MKREYRMNVDKEHTKVLSDILTNPDRILQSMDPHINGNTTTFLKASGSAP